MSEQPDDAARQAWQGQSTRPGNGEVGAMIERRLRERRQRVRRFLGSAAIIVPSYIAALVYRPDLRPVAIVGLAVGAALAWQVFRRSTAAARAPSAGLPCAAFQVEVLSRERDFHRSISGWGMVPLIVGQLAIIATLLTNDRFEKNAMFGVSLSAFIVTVAAVLVFVFRRSRRMLGALDREIAILERGVEA